MCASRFSTSCTMGLGIRSTARARSCAGWLPPVTLVENPGAVSIRTRERQRHPLSSRQRPFQATLNKRSHVRPLGGVARAVCFVIVFLILVPFTLLILVLAGFTIVQEFLDGRLRRPLPHQPGRRPRGPHASDRAR